MENDVLIAKVKTVFIYLRRFLQKIKIKFFSHWSVPISLLGKKEIVKIKI